MSVAELSSARVTSQIAGIQEALKGMLGGDVVATRPNLGSQTEYKAGSAPPGVHLSVQELALVANEATIDLTALAGGAQDTIDGTGLRLQVLYVCGRDSNGALTISEGDANPYELFGGANPIIYPAACTLPWLFQFDDKLVDIAAGAKDIELDGTGTDVFVIGIILG